MPHRHYLNLSPVEDERDNDQQSQGGKEGDLQGPLRRRVSFPNAGRTITRTREAFSPFPLQNNKLLVAGVASSAAFLRYSRLSGEMEGVFDVSNASTSSFLLLLYLRRATVGPRLQRGRGRPLLLLRRGVLEAKKSNQLSKIHGWHSYL